MAIQNKLTANNGTTKSEQVMVYTLGNQEVKLTPAVVKNYMVSGDKDRVTTQEIVTFMNLCKFAGLNPWLKEAYCIKYGNEPATMVTGKAAFMKRADDHPKYDGMESGIIVFDSDTGSIEFEKGTFCMPGSTIIGGWATVYRKDQSHPTHIEVSFEEYAGRRKDGSLNGQWAKKPATMIRKVAQVQALREAFPNSFSGMYTAEEVGYEEAIETTGEVISERVADPEPVSVEPVPSESNSNVAAALFGGE